MTKMTDAEVRAKLERIEEDLGLLYLYAIKFKQNKTVHALRLLAESQQALGEIIPLALKIKENEGDSDSYEIHCNADFIVEIARKHYRGGK